MVREHSDDDRPSTSVVDVWRETLRRNVVEQAAMMLLQHVTLTQQNSNGNAFDEHRHGTTVQRDEREFKRTNKCNSWLSTLITKDDRSINRRNISPPRLPIYQRVPNFHFHPPRVFSEDVSPYIRSDPKPSNFHQMILSSNAMTNSGHTSSEPLSQPIIMVHKKRLRRDYFLSTMQNCVQPPYSQNHFYAFDQINMRKLQQNLPFIHDRNDLNQRQIPVRNIDRHRIQKRKFEDDNRDLPDCICSETLLARKQNDDYHPREMTDQLKERINPIDSPKTFDDDNETKNQRENSTSEVILSRLEKILGLCSELRSLAKDVESHVNSAVPTGEPELQRTALRSQSPSTKSPKKTNEEETDESEQTIIDICKELEAQQSTATIDEKNAPPPYQHTDEMAASVHSNNTPSHPLMRRKSDITSKSHTNLRKAEDICMCFLKSFFEDPKSKTNESDCELNADEQAYLNELTRAYLLGKEQVLKEQQQQMDQKQNMSASQNQHNIGNDSMVKDTNNNNNNNNQTFSFDIPRSITPVGQSSFLFDNQLQAISFPVPLETNDSMATLADDDLADNQQQQQQQSVAPSVKHQLFVNEPIATKSTIVLPGIGTKYAHLLAQYGFLTVRRLLGFYLMIKDDQDFTLWLNTKVGLPKHSAWLCTHALRAWCRTHI